MEQLELGYRDAMNAALVARADYLSLLEDGPPDALGLLHARRHWERLERRRQDALREIERSSRRSEPPVAHRDGLATSSRR
jgi:hypothetical protein